MPAPPAEAVAAGAAPPRHVRRRQFAGAMFAGPQDLSLWERCITRGVPAAIFPTVYNANIRIVQGPGAVAITYEMIHDTRVIPIGPRRTSAQRSADTKATRAGTGKATRSSSTRRTSARRQLPRLRRDAAHHRALHARSRRDQLRGDGGRSARCGRSRGRRRSRSPNSRTTRCSSTAATKATTRCATS